MNSDLDQYKSLWGKKQASRLIPATDLLTKAGNLTSALRKKQKNQVFSFAFTTLAIIYTHWISSQKTETSQTGFFILLTCSLYYTLTRFFLYRLLVKIKLTAKTLEMLRKIKKYNQINQFLLTEGQLIYVIVLSTGVYLYLRPIVQLMHLNLAPGHLGYLNWVWICYILWIIYHTFFIRRKEAREEEAKIRDLISSLESNTL